MSNYTRPSGHIWQFGNRKNPLSSKAAAEDHYCNILKHSLLFHRRVTLVDHMVANSANLLRGLQNRSLKDYLRPDWIALAYVEPRRDAPSGKIATRSLDDLRKVYRQYGLLDASIPCDLVAPDFDSAVAVVADHTTPIYSQDSTGYDREYLLKDYFIEFIDSHHFARLVPSVRSDYRDDVRTQIKFAIDECERLYGPLGIIHLDPDHRDPQERTIYEVMDDIPGLKGDLPHPVHNRNFVREVSEVANAFLLKAESKSLGIPPILTPNEARFDALFVSGDYGELVPPATVQRHEISLSSACLSPKGLSILTAHDIDMFRQSDEAAAFFDLTDGLAAGTSITASDVETIVQSYIRRIDKHTFDKYQAIRREKASPISDPFRVGLSVWRWYQSQRGEAKAQLAVRISTKVADIVTFKTAGLAAEMSEAALDSLAERQQAFPRAKRVIQSLEEITRYDSIGH